MKKYVWYILVLSCLLSLQRLTAQKIQQAGIFVGKNTHFYISGKTQVITSGNVEILSPVTGKGQLKITGKQNSKLDAHGNSIAHLVVAKTGKARLSIASEVHITRQFTLQSGTLVLNDNDVVVEEQAGLFIAPSSDVLYFGKGQIIHRSYRTLKTILTQFTLQTALLPTQDIVLQQHDVVKPFVFLTKSIHNCNDKPPTPPA